MGRTIRRGAPAVFGLICLSFSIYVAQTARRPALNNASQGGRDASTLYAKNCATCHGKDGHARTFKARFNHARDLADARWQADMTDERLFNSITAGRGKMPAFGKKLSEAEINALVAYVRNLKR